MASYGVLDMKYPILKRKYHYINSNFGNRSYYNSAGRKVSDFHKGIDCQSNSSDHTDYILSPWSGKVIGYCNTMSGTTTDTGTAGMGNYLKVELGNGWTTSFQHMKKGSVKFKTGDKVPQGAEIGYIGLTGNTSGYHLHFDLFVKGDQTAKYGGRYFSSLGRTYVDPKPYLAGTLALPWNESSAPSTGNYVVTADVNVRKGAGTGYAKLTFKQLTTNAQKQIKAIDSSCPDHFPKGIKVTISQVKEASNGTFWGKCPSGWICLTYALKV